MHRKTVLPVLAAILAFCAAGAFSEAEAGMLFRRGFNRGELQGEFFPAEGAVPGLKPIGKLLTYRSGKFEELYGTAGERYIQFGMTKLMSANYEYRGGGLSLEIVTLEEPIQASGLYHYHRGKVLRTPGKPMPVGAEGILDTGRGGRNLYFYRSNMFVKVVYSGKEPVPDLMPVAEFVDKQLPSRYDDKPDGIEYIKIRGVNEETIATTAGFTFDNMALPASVWASAPGGGSQASDLFVITRQQERDAQEVFEEYAAYLKMYAKTFEEYDVEGRPYVKGVDPGQGRVVFTRHRNAVIIAARPDGFEKGEVLIRRVMERIDRIQGASGENDRSRRARAEGRGRDEEPEDHEGFRWNPFRKR